MFALDHRWPLGLDRKNWPDHAAALIFVLFVLVFFDVWVSQSLQAWPDVWRAPFSFITDFGLSDWVLIPALLVFVLTLLALLLPLSRYRPVIFELSLVSSFFLVGVGVPGLVANGLKRLFGRARPEHYLETGGFHFQHFLNDWTFQSFPSGHATTAIGTAFLVSFMAPRFFRLILLIAVMTGLSRIVIGMHYPTDVVAGFAIGMLGAYAARNIYARRRWLFAFRTDGTVRFRGTPHLRRAWRRLFQRARA
ncbi:MAG TPA: phosphatase PAP2 family protein [Devosia sp.]|jgi:membrane-associated phospholipid phosphatase|nr:phosphatase PAP2 family protein [Devosia sp.]